MPESCSTEAVHRLGDHDGNDEKRQDLTYRFATAADLTDFYGALPRMTVRAVTILLDDKPVAIIGVTIERECARFYSDMKPELEPHLRRFQVLRAIQLAMRLVRECGRNVYAVREEGTDLLERLGFTHKEGDVYVWQV